MPSTVSCAAWCAQVGGVKVATSVGVSADSYEGRLVFSSVKKSDEGRYTCTAINDVGADTGHVDLRVLGNQHDIPQHLYVGHSPTDSCWSFGVVVA